MAAPIKIELHPEAIEETRAARAWYRERSTRAEKAFLGELRRALRQVRESPETWPKIERGARRFVLRRFPFSFVYRVTQDGVVLAAVEDHLVVSPANFCSQWLENFVVAVGEGADYGSPRLGS